VKPAGRGLKPIPLVPLPRGRVRFSKRMVVVSVVMILAGLALIFSPWRLGLLTGVLAASLGLGIFFSAGYYWTCDNESCG